MVIRPADHGIFASSGGGAVGAGYFGGGWVAARVDTVDKFSFPNDSRTTLGTGLSAVRQYLAAMANSGTAGYFGGGIDNPDGDNVDTVDKFAFSDDSRTTLGTGLSAATGWLSGMANSGTAGYFGGGIGASFTDAVDKFAFSDDGRSTLGTGLSAARYYMAAMANSGTAGYFCGGYEVYSPYIMDTVDKFAFSDDSRSTLGTGLSAGRWGWLAGMANSGTAGYVCGGKEAATVDTVDKFAFSDDSRSTLATGLSAATWLAAAMADSGTAGYFGGGYDADAAATVSTVDKFDFSDDSRSTLGTGLSAATYGLAGMADGNIA